MLGVSAATDDADGMSEGAGIADAAGWALEAATGVPPAGCALRAAMRGCVLRDADKVALCTGVALLVYALLPAPIAEASGEAGLLMHAPVALAMLLEAARAAASATPPPASAGAGGGDVDISDGDEVPKPAVDRATYSDAPLYDSHATHRRLESPVRVRIAGGGTGRKLYSRQLLLRKLGGGDLALPGDPLSRATLDDVVDDAHTAALLLSHPSGVGDGELCLEAQLRQPPASTPSGAAAAAALRDALLGAARADWAGACARALSAPGSRPLQLHPPMALKRAAAPARTRGADGRQRAFLGVQDCSTNASLYCPLRRKTETVDPDALAAALERSRLPLGEGFTAGAADDRVPTELLIVALDTSGSMTSAFRTDAEEDYGALGGPLNAASVAAELKAAIAMPPAAAAAAALARLAASEELPRLAALAARSSAHRAGVLQLIAEEDETLQALSQREGSRRIAAVIDAAPRAAQPSHLPSSTAAAAQAATGGAVPSFCVTVTLPANAAGSRRRLLLPAAPSYTIALLLARVEERSGIPAQRCALHIRADVFRAHSLPPAATLMSCGVGPMTSALDAVLLGGTDWVELDEAQRALRVVRVVRQRRLPPAARSGDEPLFFKVSPGWAGAPALAQVTVRASQTLRDLKLEIFGVAPTLTPAAHAYYTNLRDSTVS
jgi:hypothetical protein